MKNPIRLGKHLLRLLVVVCGSFLLAGCATTDPENASERPWNAPKNWEGGLPSNMNQGR